MTRKKEPVLNTASLAAAFSEIQRRRAFSRSVHHGGRPATCECGLCPKCIKREKMRQYRKLEKAAKK